MILKFNPQFDNNSILILYFILFWLDDLRNFFSNFGDVREAVVLFDNNRGASRCFGFVTFDSKETVDLLVKDNNYVIKGKPVDVKQALPKALQKVQ